ncbi:MAG: amino acid ABC transporter permease [Trueperaceae bacterium]
MEQILNYYFNLEVIARYLPDLLKGLLITVEMAVLIILLGVPLGLLLAVVRTYRIRPLNWLIVFLVDFFRAIPLLVIVVLTYFALPYAGIVMSSFTATVVALTLVLAAFAEEIFWAGITAIDKGQWEAARSTGLNRTQAIFVVILPQAIQIAIPPLTNRTIAITKGTSLGSVIAVQEILSVATSAQSLAANPSPLTMGAILYLILFFPFVRFTRWLERRYGSWRSV